MWLRGVMGFAARWGVRGGVVLSVAIAGVWVGSARFEAQLVGEPFYLRTTLGEGALRFDALIVTADGTRSGWGNPGWYVRDTGKVVVRWLPRAGRGARVETIVAPLWLVVVALVAATYGLRRTLPRRGPRDCRVCGYDLAGLGEGAACPECGSMGRAARGVG